MENLRQLMGAYFHQDWSDEYAGSWESAVDDFVRREPRRVVAAQAEIGDLLTRGNSDLELGEALYELGNYRSPGHGPDAHRRWLMAIQDRLRLRAETPALP